MYESLIKVIDYIPFFGLAVGNNTAGTTPIVTRLIEAAIIGAVIMYGTVQVLGERIDNIATVQKEMKQELRDFKQDFYRPTLPR